MFSCSQATFFKCVFSSLDHQALMNVSTYRKVFIRSCHMLDIFYFYSNMCLFTFSAMIIMTYAFGGISAAISLIVLPIPAIRQYLCSKLGKNQLQVLIWRCCKYTNKCNFKAFHCTSQIILQITN